MPRRCSSLLFRCYAGHRKALLCPSFSVLFRRCSVLISLCSSFAIRCSAKHRTSYLCRRSSVLRVSVAMLLTALPLPFKAWPNRCYAYLCSAAAVPTLLVSASPLLVDATQIIAFPMPFDVIHRFSSALRFNSVLCHCGSSLCYVLAPPCQALPQRIRSQMKAPFPLFLHCPRPFRLP